MSGGALEPDSKILDRPPFNAGEIKIEDDNDNDLPGNIFEKFLFLLSSSHSGITLQFLMNCNLTLKRQFFNLKYIIISFLLNISFIMFNKRNAFSKKKEQKGLTTMLIN